MLLRDWRFERELSLAALAEMVRTSTGSKTTATVVSRWERGIYQPNKREMVAVYLLTGGKVTPNDFYELPELLPEQVAA
jgi:transcriptional regulator with XRE-family HTH domain